MMHMVPISLTSRLMVAMVPRNGVGTPVVLSTIIAIAAGRVFLSLKTLLKTTASDRPIQLLDAHQTTRPTRTM
ncbi:hypothetical protein BSZ35_06590 [Salinibacter sp. 10B]|nr:hypothetical protein BSZ35_06590 [Salinibacter sp. 10B]